MLTPAAAFTTAMSKGVVEPVFLVEITTAVGTSTKLQSGPSSTMSYPMSVGSVTPVTRAMDVQNRSLRIGSTNVVLREDAVTKALVTGTLLRNKGISIKIGTSGLAEGNFEDYFVGIISKQPVFVDGVYRVQVSSALVLPRDFEMIDFWIDKHPLEIIEDIFDKSGMDSSQYDATSLDPTNYGTTISHWNASSGKALWMDLADIEAAEDIATPIKAFDMIDGLATMMNGQIVEQEDGEIGFSLFDASAAVSDNWTDRDIRDFKTVSLDDNIINKVEVVFGHRNMGGPVEQPSTMLRSSETGSQVAFKFPGGSNYIKSKKYDPPTLTANSFLPPEQGTVSAGATSFVMSGPPLFGFCGARWPNFNYAGGPAQPATAAVSGTLLSYLRIEDEIIEVSALTIDPNVVSESWFINPITLAVDQFRGPARATVTVSGGAAGRGVKGTDAADHAAGSVVLDYTIAIDMAESRLNRFHYGAPVLEVTTSLAKYALQIGDLITITSSRYRAFTEATLTTSTKWEITGKEVNVSGEDTNIKWTLVWATKTSPPSKTFVDTVWSAAPQNALYGRVARARNADVVETHIALGMAVTDSGSGSTINIATGVVAGDGSRSRNIAERSITLPTPKDCYISWSTVSNEAIVRVLPLSDPAPTYDGVEAPLAKVVTSSGPDDIDSVTDLRETQAMDGGKLVALSVDSAQLANDAVITAKINALAVTSAELAANAVIEAKIGNLEVSTGKIQNDAITTAKILDANVTGGKLANGIVSSSKMDQVISFSAYADAATTLATKAYTIIELNQTVYNYGSDFDTGGYKFTAPFDGVFVFSAGVQINSIATSTNYRLSLYLDTGGGAALAKVLSSKVFGVSQNVLLGGNTQLDLSSGDEVTLRAYNDHAATTYDTSSGATVVWFMGAEAR
jgi:hypothetical protein